MFFTNTKSISIFFSNIVDRLTQNKKPLQNAPVTTKVDELCVIRIVYPKTQRYQCLWNNIENNSLRAGLNGDLAKHAGVCRQFE